MNAYKPKKLDDALNRIGMRAAMFGAIYDKKYPQLPTCEWCKVVWEASAHYFVFILNHMRKFNQQNFPIFKNYS